MKRDWSEAECGVLVTDYFEMLTAQERDVPFNKAGHRRDLLPKLDRRSEHAVERKRQNVSAVLENLGLRYLRGYKPQQNHQLLLQQVVERELKKRRELAKTLAKSA